MTYYFWKALVSVLATTIQPFVSIALICFDSIIALAQSIKQGLQADIIHAGEIFYSTSFVRHANNYQNEEIRINGTPESIDGWIKRLNVQRKQYVNNNEEYHVIVRLHPLHEKRDASINAYHLKKYGEKYHGFKNANDTLENEGDSAVSKLKKI